MKIIAFYLKYQFMCLFYNILFKTKTRLFIKIKFIFIYKIIFDIILTFNK